ncbi:hypothetical protein [Facklamia sp. P12955]|uniref:hypothetical protein n=1 Tax=unclassified Facklamia TaxID=2622293 RepID=UPI003D17BB91
MKETLKDRVESLEAECAALRRLLNEFERATLNMVDEKIKEATFDYCTLDEVGDYYDLEVGGNYDDY